MPEKAELKEVNGIGASPGQVSGRVRLIGKVHPKDMNVGHGDIVVSSHLTPEQTVHFKKASALVADVGGRSSHAAVIAREWGIPAVVGVLSRSGVRPTEILKEGDTISVDGTSGIVVIQGGPPLPPPKVELTESEKAREKFGDIASRYNVRLSVDFLRKMGAEGRHYLKEGD